MARKKTRKNKGNTRTIRRHFDLVKSVRVVAAEWVAKHPRLAAGLYVACFAAPSFFVLGAAIATSVNGFLVISALLISENKRRTLWESSVSFRLLELRRSLASKRDLPAQHSKYEKASGHSRPNTAPRSSTMQQPATPVVAAPLDIANDAPSGADTDTGSALPPPPVLTATKASMRATSPLQEGASVSNKKRYQDMVMQDDDYIPAASKRLREATKRKASFPGNIPTKRKVLTQKSAQQDSAVRRNAAAQEHYYSDTLIREFISTALAAKKIRLIETPVLRLTDGQVPMIKFSPELESYTGRFLSEDRFMPVAEKYGLQHKIAALVLDKAVEAIRNSPAAETIYAIDIRKDGLIDPHFMSRLLDITRYSRSDFARLSFEMSYSDFENASARSIQMMRNMAQLGGKFALHDVEELRPDLELLQKVGVKTLKFKIAYIKPMMPITERFREAMNACRVIEASGIRFIIDGIEDVQEVQALQLFSPRHIQGSLLANKDFVAILSKRKAA